MAVIIDYSFSLLGQLSLGDFASNICCLLLFIAVLNVLTEFS